jgi:hypothetical protein
MKKQSALFIAGSFMLAFASCDSTKQANTTTTTTANNTETKTQTSGTTGTTTAAGQGTGAVMEKNGLKVYSFDDSPRMAEAAMRVTEPAANSTVPAGKVTFNYQLSNYQLTKMTGHDHAKEMANSMQGQHIHNIVDNEPYTAHYETNFTKDIKEGNHVVLSFLSRSYHESLKHNAAYDLRMIRVGNPKGTNNFDLKGQHMFYSRPKGEYVGNDTKKIMLDFYLVNTSLSPEGNKVRATINGTEFMLDRWLPYSIEGMPMGENKIKLELLDNAGNVIPGPYNTVERTITLKAA